MLNSSGSQLGSLFEDSEMTHWVLASSSPRRQELLKLFWPISRWFRAMWMSRFWLANHQKNWLRDWLARRPWRFRRAIPQLELSVPTLWWFVIERFWGNRPHMTMAGTCSGN